MRALAKPLLMAVITIVGLASCKKLDQPKLPSDYPKDTNVTPATSLRFSLNFDSTSPAAKQLNIRFADSISTYPSFFPDGSITAGPGVKGTAFQSAGSSYIHYYSANDMGSAKSFTLAFWMNVPLAKKDNNHAVGIMALSSTSGFWSNIAVYADNTTKGASDSMDLKFHFANGTGDNWDFAGYTGKARWPKMYDGNWHQVVFTYDATAKTGIMYRDGVVFDTKTNETIVFDGKAGQFVLGGFQEAAGIVDSYSNNTWMGYFTGSIDQLKMYNVAISASDVANLYSSKQ
ncbi:MAG: LamG domain-containing protein [Bacteroidota bacterium]